jgi:hypothetical protein
MFCRHLTVAHRCRLKQESSPDHLAFQVAHTTISPNYPGEDFETPDHQILVVYADIPPQDGETDEQRQERENANAARAIRRQQELAIAALVASQPPANTSQVNVNVGQQAPAAPAAPQQRRRDDPPRANRLRARSPQGLRARRTRSLQLTANKPESCSCCAESPRRFPNDLTS